MSGEAPGAGDGAGDVGGRSDGTTLVKNLLFPSYTDAGSNEAFQSTSNDNIKSADISAERGVEESMLTHTGADRSLNVTGTSATADDSNVSISSSPLPKSPLVPPTPVPRGSPRDKGSPAYSNASTAAETNVDDPSSSSGAAAGNPAPKSPPKMLRKTNPPLPPSAATAIATNNSMDDHDRTSVSIQSSATGASSILGTKFLDGHLTHEVSSTVSTNIIGNLSGHGHEVSSTVSTNVIGNLSGDLVAGAAAAAASMDDEPRKAGEEENGVLHLSAENLERISPSKASRKQHVRKDDDADEVNSMTSHMGSEPGERKLRLDEVVHMEAVAESDDDDDDDENENEGHNDSSGRQSAYQSAREDLALPVLSASEMQQQQQQQPRNVRSTSTSASVGVANTSTDGDAAVPPSPMKSLSAAINRVSHSISGRATPSGGVAGSAQSTSRASPSWTPKTPRSPHPSGSQPEQQQQQQQQQLGSSISSLLRSPRLSNQGDTGASTTNAVLSPRFSSLSPYRRTSPSNSQGSAAPQNLLLSPFQRARGCMSFDSSAEGGIHGGTPPPSPSMGGRSRKVLLQQRNSHSPKETLKQRSQSWDSETAHRYIDGAARLYARHESDPVRQEPSSAPSRARRRHLQSPRNLTGISSAKAEDAFRNPGGTATYVRGAGGGDGRYNYQQQSVRAANSSPASQNTRAAATSQRIEIEREDAIDLLSCLVQRSIAFHDKNDQYSGDDSKGKADYVDNNNQESPEALPKPEQNIQRSSSLSEMNEAVRTLRIISQNYNREQSNEAGDEENDANTVKSSSCLGPDHDVRMRVMDELLRSHTYAVEMQRAALSASTWLKAIGRSDGLSEGAADAARPSSSENNMQINYSYSNSSTGVALPDDNEGKSKEGTKTSDKAGVDPAQEAITKMDIISLKAQLHSAELKAAEKVEYAKRLDDELAKCRTEIGRLKSASRTEALFSSPNKSIFDVEEEEESSVSSSEASDKDIAPRELESALNDVSAVAETGDDAVAAADITTSTQKDTSVEMDRTKEIILLKAALEEANAKLRTFEDKVSTDADSDDGQDVDKVHGEGEPGMTQDKDETSDGLKEGKAEGEKESADRAGAETENKEDESKESTPSPTQADATATDTLPASLSNPALEKDLENYRDAIRKADSAEIDALKRALEEVKATLTAQSPAKTRPECSPGNKEERMINVRMLDGENFVTEFEPMSPLPPPPDHGLRCPLVYDLLSQWTSDQTMQESLLGWVERILAGDDPAVVPPLKISSLDHRSRDGFTMHIIPLLLRRHDIHVEVTTRAHRRTSYDIAVSVSRPLSDRNGGVSFGRNTSTVASQRTPGSKHMMAFKASRGGTYMEEDDVDDNPPGLQEHVRSKVSEYLRGNNNKSSAETGTGSIANASDVTSRISNIVSIGNNMRPSTEQQGRLGLAPRPGPSHDSALIAGPSGDEFSVDSSLTGGSRQRNVQSHHSEQEQPGIVGRAFGLLSRRKDDAQEQRANGNLPPHDIRGSVGNQHDVPPSTSRLQMPSLIEEEGGQSLLYATQEKDEHYHRVVSVPPGKIGITFVQYRGHAMVSDVSPESPLSGWVFPSDIVIAVDEKAVSGLRVREIVDLLKARKDRQRALRVISSHDLTDIVQQEAPSALLG